MHVTDRIHPRFDLLVDLVSCFSVAFLEKSFELLTLSVDDIKVVVRELAPLLFDAAAELLPISLYLVPVHRFLLYTFSGA
jgi:hypothetical protein